MLNCSTRSTFSLQDKEIGDRHRHHVCISAGFLLVVRQYNQIDDIAEGTAGQKDGIKHVDHIVGGAGLCLGVAADIGRGHCRGIATGMITNVVSQSRMIEIRRIPVRYVGQKD